MPYDPLFSLADNEARSPHPPSCSTVWSITSCVCCLPARGSRTIIPAAASLPPALYAWRWNNYKRCQIRKWALMAEQHFHAHKLGGCHGSSRVSVYSKCLLCLFYVQRKLIGTGRGRETATLMEMLEIISKKTPDSMSDFSVAFHNLEAISIPSTTRQSCHLSSAHTGSIDWRLAGR